MTGRNIKTTCSECRTDLRVELVENGTYGKVRATISSNGLRGAKHVAKHEVAEDVWADDAGLFLWECPACGHADSFDPFADDPAYA